MKFKYKITKFDKENNLVVVVFENGSWADIRLVKPLPKNIEELEEIIKRYTEPKEAIEAITAPDADLSYIDEALNTDREADRLVLNPPSDQEGILNSSEPSELVDMWQDLQFQKRVGDALVSLGVLENNPLALPVQTQ